MELTPPPYVVLVLAALAAASLVAWLRIGGKLLRGESIVPHEPHGAVAWGGLEAVVPLVLIVLFQSAGQQLVLSAFGIDADGTVKLADLPPRVTAASLAATGVSTLLAVAAAALLFARRGARRPRDFGLALDGRTLAYDVRLAFTAFVTALAPVFVLQAILIRLFPTQHVVLELLQKQPTLEMALAAGFTAVLAAPIAEEFAFRLALQGWLEKLERRRFARLAVPAEASDALAAEIAPATETESGEVVSAELAAPQPLGRWQGLVPVLVSSTVFALLHAGAGPAPISLFPLALILGYLYLRTGRLLPCVLTHLFFNGLNLALLLLSLPEN